MTEHPAFTELFDMIGNSDDLDKMTTLLAEIKSAHVDIETRSKINDATLLEKAADFGELPVVQLLLAAGANPNQRNHIGDKWTALVPAARGGHLEIVELLLAAGADPTVVDDEGCTIVEQMSDAFAICRAEDVADEAKTKDLLQHRAEELDVGSLASR